MMASVDLVGPALLLAAGSTVLVDTLVAPAPSLFELRIEALYSSDHPQRPGGPMRAVLHHSARAVERLRGDTCAVELLQQQAGSRPDHLRLRVEQARWGWVALAGTSILAAVEWVAAAADLLGCIILVVSCTSGAVLAPEHLLRRAARGRVRRMQNDLPVLADVFTLAAAAGHRPMEALAYVADRHRGTLGAELRHGASRTRSGASLVVTLEELADRVRLPEVTRFVEAFVEAWERGTSPSDVLRSQAASIRDDARSRHLQEMRRRCLLWWAVMVPVVLAVVGIFATCSQWPTVFLDR